MVDAVRLFEPRHTINFNVRGTWMIRLDGDGVHFNREVFPDSTPDDFAQAFIDILEGAYAVTFQRNVPEV